MGMPDEYRIVENLLLSSSDVLCALDAAGRLWRVSTVAQHVLGYAPDELNGAPLGTLLHPADRAQVEAACQAARQQAPPVEVAGRALTKTGQEIRLAWSIFWWPAPALLLCVGRAAATQPPAPAESPASNARLEHIADGYIEVDKDWLITYFNAQAERVLQVDRQQCLGRNYWEAFPNAINSRFDDYLHLAMDSGQPVHFEVLSTRTSRWLEVRTLPTDGGLSIFLSNITNRVTAAKHLEQLALVAQGTNNGVLITDAQGRTEWVNDGFTKHTGYTLADMVGRTPDTVLEGPDTDPEVSATIRDYHLQRRQEAFSTTVLNYTKAGEKLWVLLHVTPIYNQAGELTQFISIQQNINAQKAMEAQQAQLTQDLYEHNRDLQQFTYMLSHNLRAPLANALGLSKLLAQADRPRPVFDASLGYLRQSLEQVDGVLHDLNLVLSIRDRQHRQAPETVALAEVAQQALQHWAPALAQCAGHVALALAEGLMVRGNRAYVYSIFDNLLSNALKYRSPERPLRIDIRGVAGAHGGVHIHFADNGLGFDQAKAGPKVFQLYQRFHGQQQGRGLGLFLIKTHVEAMGGTIEVSSQVGVGTRFLIHLNTH